MKDLQLVVAAASFAVVAVAILLADPTRAAATAAAFVDASSADRSESSIKSSSSSSSSRRTTKKKSNKKKSSLNNLQGGWITIDETAEFQLATAALSSSSFSSSSSQHENDSDNEGYLLRQAQRRFLSSSPSYASNFADGSETYYDEYSTAWRLMGFYIDCSSLAGTTSEDEEERYSRRNRRRTQDNENGCIRYLLWGAYVDLDYTGGGIGEYEFYDPDSGEWDASACKLRNSARCVKMDCHLPNSHFKLLGLFKHYDYDNWLEQLIQHQGYCIWDKGDYEFMDTYREMWPVGCQKAPDDLATTDDDDDDDDGGTTQLYYDVMPSKGGTMDLGLYTDKYCIVPYTGQAYSLSNIIDEANNADDDSSTLNSTIATWNRALTMFEICQPCKSYSRGSSYIDDDDDNSPNGGYFYCEDVAGGVNVNQCMTFKTEANLEVASYSDIELASAQQTTQFAVNAEVVQTYWSEWGLFTVAAAVLVCGLLSFCWAARPPRVVKGTSVSPLMEDE